MKNTKVLISGAGIGGPVLAFWLRRYGFTPTIVEQSSGIRPGGQTVDVRGAGREVAERMGLVDAIRALAVKEEGMAYIDDRGRHVAEIPESLFGDSGPVTDLEIMRGDLAQILWDATKNDVEYIFGDKITALTQQADGVKVDFKHGATRTFDLVIGADGIHSSVRALAFGPESEFVKPLGGYTAIFTAKAFVNTEGWMLMHATPGGITSMVRPDRDPSKIKVGFTFRSPALDIARNDVAAQQRLLNEKLANAGWEIPGLLAAMGEADDFYFDSYCQVKMDSYSRGRVAVLGDAGYCGSPLSGKGTSLALVGAYVLAGELASAGGDHEQAFAAYEKTMRPYVEQCQKLPPGGLKNFAPGSRFAIAFRNLMVKVMLSKPLRGVMAKQVGEADAITVVDYPTAAVA